LRRPPTTTQEQQQQLLQQKQQQQQQQLQQLKELKLLQQQQLQQQQQQQAQQQRLHQQQEGARQEQARQQQQRQQQQQQQQQQQRQYQQQQQLRAQKIAANKSGPAPRSPQQSAFVFACSRQTQDECIDLMLFGGTKTLINDKRRAVGNIQFGTPLFLLNMQTDTVFGPFFAESGMAFNHDPSAWGSRTVRGQKESAYPCQVCVDISEWEAEGSPDVQFRKSDPINRALRATKGGGWVNEQIHRALVTQLGVEFPPYE
jgi:hypothetical protein